MGSFYFLKEKGHKGRLLNMKKIIFALIIVVMWAPSILAEVYNSPFGFSIDLPSHWLILSKQELQDNPDLLNFEREEFKSTNKDFLNNIKNMIVSGQVEVYLNKKASNFSFNENINVVQTIERLPQTVSELDQFCANIPQLMSENYGKSIKVYECELKKVAGLNSLYFIVDGILDETKNIMYQFQKSPSVAITITATCRNETLEIFKKEFDEIIATLTFNDIATTKNSEIDVGKITESEEERKPPEPQEEIKSREFNYDDGSKYIGDILDGKRHGQGTYIWPSGDKYVGEFESNRATGGWLFRTGEKKVWVYQDAEGEWIIKDSDRLF